MAEPGNTPTFINVGPGRCGTSWLFQMLQAHPEVAMARVKETEYFNSNFDRGAEWYTDHFPQAAKAVGEVSNMYYLDKEVPGRIRDFNPDTKIIFNVRDPKDLLLSMASFAARRGIEMGDIDKLLEMPIGRIMGSGWAERARQGKLTDGDQVPLKDAVRLSTYIQRFADSFPADQIFILDYARIAQDPLGLLADLYGFLGVQADFVPEGAGTKVNAAIAPRIRFVGQIATKVSFVLRQLGLHGLLTRLHKSELIKRVFYRPIQSSGVIEASSFPAETLTQLARERQAMDQAIAGINQSGGM